MELDLEGNRRYSDDIGAVFAKETSATPSDTLKADHIYVRARVTSSKAKENASGKGEFERAWTQSIWKPRK